MPKILGPPAICPACGNDLPAPQPLCDHGLALRGEARWVEDAEAQSAHEQALIKARQKGSVALTLGAIWVLLCVEKAPFLQRWPVAIQIALGFLLFLMAILSFQQASALEQRKFYRVEAPPELAFGLAELVKGQLINASGRGQAFAPVRPGFVAHSTRDLLDKSRNLSAFQLLRAALLHLISIGAVRLQITRDLAWNRSSLARVFPRVQSSRVLFQFATLPSGESLPWLERQLLATLETLTAGSATSPSQVSSSPYRSPEDSPAEPPRWVSLGALLRTFHRLHGAQPFHRAWYQKQAQSDPTEVPRSTAEPEEIPAEIAVFFTRNALRRSFDTAPSDIPL